MPSKASYPSDLPYLVKEIASLFEQYTSQESSESKSESARRSLAEVAQKLVIAARSPEENIFAIAQQPAQNAALRSLIALGVPDVLPADGAPKSLDEISEAVDGDERVVGRILQAASCTGLVDEHSELNYAHNAISRTLLSPANRSLITLMFDYNGRGVMALPEFLGARQWKDAGSYSDCAFMLGSRVDQPMWTYRDSNKQCREVFDLGMQSELVASMATGLSSGPFPFGPELLGQDTGATASQVTIVDIGGGHGQALVDIQHNFPELKQARFVLLDLASVIENAVSAGLPCSIQPVAGSFFDEIPVKGATVYYIRRCLHNWDDDACHKILLRVADAMDRATSRLVITDMVVDDVHAAREMAWEDLNMMTIGGIERTERHWRSLLARSGFRVDKIWRHSKTEHATIDARLR